jgi:uncharacterized protein (UPF0261 family)
MVMAKTVGIVGALDTKGIEFAFLKNEIEKRGFRTLVINVGILSQLSLPSTATDWNVWADKTQTVSLRSGLNTIAIKYDTGDTGWVNLDYINIEPAR